MDLILFLGVKTDSYICPAFVLAKFYSNNLLVLLNFRIKIKGGRGEVGDASVLVYSPDSNATFEPDKNEHLSLRDSFRAMFRRSPTTTKTPIIFSTINIQMTQEFETDDVQLSNIHVR